MTIKCYNQTNNAIRKERGMSEYKYNAKKIAYDTKYRAEHYDRIEIRLPKGYKDTIKDHVSKNGININVWLKELIDKELGL